MDRLTKEQRHKNMSHIKNKDTGIEEDDYDRIKKRAG